MDQLHDRNVGDAAALADGAQLSDAQPGVAADKACAHPRDGADGAASIPPGALADDAAWIHASAIVDAGATLGHGTRVWHFAHVCAGAQIGAGCSLGQNVFVGNDVRIGDRVKIQNNVSVYDAVTIEDDVFCGPSMVFTNVYNPRAALVRKDEYRRTVVRHGATVGANATIVCGVTIGRHAFIGAGAVVNRDVPDFALMAGVPARHIGWMSRHGERLPLPTRGDGAARCAHTGELYTLRAGVCTLRAPHLQP